MAETDKTDADDYSEPSPKAVSEKMAERMRGIRKRYERAVEADRKNREMAKEDFRFAWIAGHQTDEALGRRRNKRPRYEFNKLGQAILQVVNNNRQNSPAIKVRATKEATKPLAEIREGLIRNIESMSHAESVYDWGALYATTSGFGAWRVTAKYADDDSFYQDLMLERIQNPLTSVWFDADAKDKHKRDANFAFLESTIGWSDFREQYPNAEFASFDPVTLSNDKTLTGWMDAKCIRIAEYWYKQEVEEEIYLLSDGRVVRAADWDKLEPVEEEDQEAIQQEQAQSGQQQAQNALSASQGPQASGVNGTVPTPPQAPAQPPAPLTLGQILGTPLPAQGPVTVQDKRTVKRNKVMMEIVSGKEVLEGPYEWAGKYIPIVPVWGILVNDDGEDTWFGMVRAAKDPQRLYNYNRSRGIEVMASQPIAPMMYTADMIKGYEDAYRNMAVDNPAGLPFRFDQGQKPERMAPPQFPAAMFQAAQVDDNDIKATTGIWQANLGQPSNETSGRAISARQAQGNTATYNYQDEMAQAVAYTGEIVNDLIPYYYDTYREIRILGADGAEKYVEANKPLWNPETQQWEKVNDLSQGQYDITCTSGPSFATQRMETLDAMLQLAQAGGPFAQLFQYAAIKNMDVPGMDDVEEAIRVQLVKMGMLPPSEGDPPPPPPKPDPKAQADLIKAQNDTVRARNDSVTSQAQAQLDTARAGKYQLETQLMKAHAPAEIASTHAQMATDAANAAVAQSDAAWQTAYNEKRHDQFNAAPLIQLDQQTLPNP